MSTKAKRKCTAIVCYHGTKYYAITAVTKKEGHDLNLVRNPDGVECYTFNAMYDEVLNILSENNLYVGFDTMFNREWYEIIWYDKDNPTLHETFGFKPFK